MLTLFKGKLTYIMAALAVIWGLVGLATGWIDVSTALTVIWGGLTTFGIRRALP